MSITGTVPIADYQIYGLLAAGPAALRPAPGILDRFYFSTDTLLLERDNGLAWVEVVRGEAAIRLMQLAERAHSSLTGIGSADHHPRYTDAEADFRIALHAAIAAAHHSRYTDAEAIAAAKTDPLLLNYTQGARVYHNIDQSVPNTTWTILAFNSERYDTDTIHDNSIINSRLTCKTAGKYAIMGNFSFEASGVGSRVARVWLNGTTDIGTNKINAAAAGGAFFSLATIYDLAVNDYIQIRVYQDSGGALLAEYNPNGSPEFMMQRIG